MAWAWMSVGLVVARRGNRIDHLGAEAESGEVICQISGPLKYGRQVDGQLLEKCGSTLVAIQSRRHGRLRQRDRISAHPGPHNAGRNIVETPCESTGIRGVHEFGAR